MKKKFSINTKLWKKVAMGLTLLLSLCFYLAIKGVWPPASFGQKVPAQDTATSLPAAEYDRIKAQSKKDNTITPILVANIDGSKILKDAEKIVSAATAGQVSQNKSDTKIINNQKKGLSELRDLKSLLSRLIDNMEEADQAPPPPTVMKLVREYYIISKAKRSKKYDTIKIGTDSSLLYLSAQ